MCVVWCVCGYAISVGAKMHTCGGSVCEAGRRMFFHRLSVLRCVVLCCDALPCCRVGVCSCVRGRVSCWSLVVGCWLLRWRVGAVAAFTVVVVMVVVIDGRCGRSCWTCTGAGGRGWVVHCLLSLPRYALGLGATTCCQGSNYPRLATPIDTLSFP